MGGKFLEVPGFKMEEGEGGYAKEMSEDFKRAQAEMIAKQVTSLFKCLCSIDQSKHCWKLKDAVSTETV